MDDLLLGRGLLGRNIVSNGLQHFLLLEHLSLLSTLPCLLHLSAAGLGLVSQHLGSGLLSLLLVDELHQDSLVLEHVTLCLQVQLVVQMPVNLLSLPVSLEEPPEDPHPLDPELLLVGPGVGCSLPLTEATVAAF